MKSSGLLKTASATFGAAMCSLYSAPELHADIFDLTFNPPSLDFDGGQINSAAITINEIGENFLQWNDGVGKTVIAGGLDSVGFVSFGQLLNASTFVGDVSATASLGATGTRFVAFRNGTNVGWFSMSLGGTGGTINYIGGQYGSIGESVIAGVSVPEPNTLALGALALGAAGIRRRRRD